MIDKNIQKLLREKYNPEGSILRRAQKKMLEMLTFIDELCMENNIPYWLDGGTLLGAARHKGFIPWDDDTDICVLEKDRIRLKQLLLNKTKGTRFILQCRETDSGYFGSWDVLRDLDSEYVVDNPIHQLRNYKGCQVDIFYVSDKVSRPFQRIAIWLHSNLVVKPIIRNESITKMDNRYRFLYYYLFPMFYKMHSVCKQKYYRYGYGVSFFDKHIITGIYPLIRIPFEDTLLQVPNNYDKYLKESFGDWEQLPDSSELRIHSTNIIFK